MGFPSRPILRRGVNPPPPKIQKRRTRLPPIGLKAWPEKALAFKASLASAFWPLLASVWPPPAGLFEACPGLLGRLWPHLASSGQSRRTLASPGLPYGAAVSRRWGPDPAFASALPMFSKGRAFAFEARKSSRQEPPGSPWPGLWHPLGPIWLAFGSQLGRQDGFKKKRNFDKKINRENH